ncbi:DeoR/GlpR family DNA-binding transcription regulator [Bacillus alkalicellulosilyticus]|uniref:DeoR/GlpR family DNA-binding transcription regulator n=1 Tax=Alkalihalobacterium alkalicellulosilyticum TaxID=1912214 RepID=UPI0009980F48|nr:DeoR/GlpR family DNA-binding transcription regulator [Bacillus alkalicellulosilyticus]
MTLLPEERFSYIIQQLQTVNKVYVIELAKALRVTPETIRRDLDTLEKEKKLVRVHGGAVPYHLLIEEPHFERKENLQHDAKVAIGKTAASFIENGDKIVVDVGTTTIHLAQQLHGLSNITIVTNSLAAAAEFNVALEKKEFDGDVIILGGVTNPKQKSVTGTLTANMLKRFRFDKAFLSCGGVTFKEITDYDMEEASLSKLMLEQSSKVFLLADQTKLGQHSFYSISSLSKVDYIITDTNKPAHWKKALDSSEVTWVVASGGEKA